MIADEFDAYNKMQVREARGYVVHRPAANLAAEIAAWRPRAHMACGTGAGVRSEGLEPQPYDP
jgi:hypothetical protein